VIHQVLALLPEVTALLKLLADVGGHQTRRQGDVLAPKLQVLLVERGPFLYLVGELAAEAQV
jgi:hypothetical protein